MRRLERVPTRVNRSAASRSPVTPCERCGTNWPQRERVATVTRVRQQQEVNVEPATKSLELARYIPEQPRCVLDRDEYARTVGDRLHHKPYVVALTGAPGAGRSFIAREVYRNAERCIGVFSSAARPLTLTMKHVEREVRAQCAALLNLYADDMPTPNLLTRLRREATAESPIIVVLDGLCESAFTGGESQTFPATMRLLPAPSERFKYVITATDVAVDALGQHCDFKPVQVHPLRESDVEALVKQAGFAALAQRLHDVSGGNLETLWLAIDMLGAGCREAVDALESASPQQAVAKAVAATLNALSPNQLVLLAGVVSAGLSFQSLARALDASEADCREISELPFVSSADGSPIVAGEVVRALLVKHIGAHMSQAREAIAGVLMAAPKSRDAVSVVPRLLSELADAEQFTDYVGAETYALAMQHAESQATLRALNECGMSMLRRGRLSSPAGLGYALRDAVLNSMQRSRLVLDKVETLYGTGGEDKAIDEALAAPFLEQRFVLLARLTRLIARDKGHVPTVLLAELREASQKLPESELERILQEAGPDLVFACPELASEIVNGITNYREPRSRREVMLGLTVRTLGRDVSQDERIHAVRALDRIAADPEFTEVLQSVRIDLAHPGTDRLLGFAREIRDHRLRLAVLRSWCVLARPDPGAADVVREGVEALYAISQTVPPDARALADILTPVREIEALDAVREIAAACHPLLEGLLEYGYRPFIVDSMLSLAQGFAGCLDYSACTEWVESAALVGMDAVDVSVRAGCFARVHEFLERVDADRRMEKRSGIHGQVESLLSESLVALATGTALHDATTEDAIRALCSGALNRAIEVAQSLNTPDRQVRAITICAVELARTARTQPEFERLRTVAETRATPDVLQQRLGAILMEIARRSPALEWNQAGDFVCWALDVLEDEDVRNAVLSTLIQVWSEDAEFVGRVASRVRDGVEQGSYSSRLRLGFAWARLASESGRDDGGGVADECYSLLSGTPLADESARSSWACSVEMAVLAFPVSSDSDLFEASLATVSGLLERVEDASLRLKLANLLVCRLSAASLHEFARSALARLVDPQLPRAGGTELERGQQELVVSAAEALALGDRDVWRDWARRLRGDYRERFIFSALNWMVRRLPLAEVAPRFQLEGRRHLSLGDALFLIETASLAETDYVAYHCLSEVAAASREHVSRYSRDQVKRIVQALRTGASGLDGMRGLAHSGYELLVRAEVLSLEQRANKRAARSSEWEALLQRVRQEVSPASDQSFVAAQLVYLMPTGHRCERVWLEAFEYSRDCAERIPSAMERGDRLLALAFSCRDRDPRRSEDLVRSTATSLPGDPSHFADRVRRQAVEVAYQLIPDLASDVARALDADPKRSPDAGEWDGYGGIARTLSGSDEAGLEGMNWSKVDDRTIHSICVEYRRRLNSGSHSGSVPSWGDGALSFISERTLRVAGAIGSSYLLTLQPWGFETRAGPLLGSVLEAFRSVLDACEFAWEIGKRSTSPVPVNWAAAPLRLFSAYASVEGKARAIAKEWLEKCSGQEVVIVERYFRVADLGVAAWPCAERRPSAFTFLVGFEGELQGLGDDVGSTLRSAWDKMFVGDLRPRGCVIGVRGRERGGFPVHDRWWFTETEFLALGGSISGLEGERVVWPVEASKADEVRSLVSGYLDCRRRRFDGDELEYRVFPL